MALRGDKLTEHILWAAKDVFLEMGFERASMDEIAERAETSKRTLYAHFENKEKLYLAVVELVRAMFLKKLKTPGDYSSDPAEALVLFCARLQQAMLFKYTIRMCRMAVSVADRFPEGSAGYFEVIFLAPDERLRAYFKETFQLTDEASSEATQKLLGRLIYPTFPRALFGLDPLSEHFPEEQIGPNFNLEPIRKAVADVIKSLGR